MQYFRTSPFLDYGRGAFSFCLDLTCVAADPACALLQNLGPNLWHVFTAHESHLGLVEEALCLSEDAGCQVRDDAHDRRLQHLRVELDVDVRAAGHKDY
jgi:hypothetical protein